MKTIKVLVFLTILFFVACKKSGADTFQAPPANLMLSAIVSNDGSGMVAFTASALNATSYYYDFGNGVLKSVATNTINYEYTASGVNTYNVTVTAIGSTGLTIKKFITVTVSVQVVARQLVWSDEFNTDGAPDPSKWGYDIGNSNGWGNAELEYYTSRPENAIVQNGVLKINAIKENYSGSSYTSARLLSKDKYDLKYGKIEFKAKLPAAVGTWPALWMLGSDVATAGWPSCGEIDIMEHRGSELNKIFGTLHYPGRSGGNADGSTKMIDSAATKFHIYSVEWSAAAIKIYVDDILYHTVVNSSNIPFNHNFFLIMNVAMGGNFAGNVDPAFTRDSMEVDYIRVYQ